MIAFTQATNTKPVNPSEHETGIVPLDYEACIAVGRREIEEMSVPSDILNKQDEIPSPCNVVDVNNIDIHSWLLATKPL